MPDNILKRSYFAAFAPWQADWNTTAPTIDMVTGRHPVPHVRGLEPLNQDSALSMGAVYRAVQIISNAVSQMEPEVFRQNHSAVENRAHHQDPIKVPSFIKRPNVDEPLTHFLEETVTSLALLGNAYWFIRYNQAGKISNINVLDANKVVKEFDDKTGRFRYSYNSKYYYTKDIKHLKLMRVPGYPYGLGPLQYCRGELQNALDLRTYQANWFTESGQATGVLKTDQPLSEEWATEYKKRWEQAMLGTDRTAVLGNGLSYQSTYLNPKDAMFIEAANFSTQQIARMWGVPASLLSLPIEGNSMTYSNTRDENSQFLRYTLSLYTNEIENTFNELLPNGNTVKFNDSSLLKLNQFDRYQAHAIALESGFKSVDEVRDEEGLVGTIPPPVSTVTDATLGNVPSNNEKKAVKNDA